MRLDPPWRVQVQILQGQDGGMVSVHVLQLLLLRGIPWGKLLLLHTSCQLVEVCAGQKAVLPAQPWVVVCAGYRACQKRAAREWTICL